MTENGDTAELDPETSSGASAIDYRGPRGIRRLALVATLTILAVAAAVLLTLRLRGFLYLVFMALFIAVALEPAVQWLEKRGWGRRAATAVVFFGSFLLFIGFIAALVPLISSQIASLVESFPELIDSVAGLLRDWFDIELDTEQLNQDLSSLGQLLSRFGEQVGGGILAIGQTLVGAITNWVTIALFAYYMLADGPRLRATVLSVFRPHRQREAMKMWEIAVEKTGGYVYSRALLAVISAVYHSVIFSLLGLPFPIPLGIWMGVLSEVIPVVGTYLGAVVPLLVALGVDPLSALWILIAIVAYQQLENFVLAPRVTAQTMEMHPAISIGAIIVGGTLMGVSGVIAALPVAAIIQAFISTSVDRHALYDDQAGTLPFSTD